jgi:hypothetical protein
MFFLVRHIHPAPCRVIYRPVLTKNLGMFYLQSHKMPHVWKRYDRSPRRRRGVLDATLPPSTPPSPAYHLDPINSFKGAPFVLAGRLEGGV